MAIINITDDSFSDGGLYLDTDSAVNHARLCIEQGAHILDLGAQSTRPGSPEVGPEIEIQRLLPVIKEVKSIFPETLISVDTFNHSVAYESLKCGADLINDVSGGRHDPEIFKVVAEFGCPYVLMHSRGNSINMDKLIDYENIIDDVKDELNKQIDKAFNSGLRSSQLIIDPGIGFAKNTLQNITLINNIEEFVSLPYPILVGASRKRFIGEIMGEVDPSKRLLGTAIVLSKCVNAKVNILRVHDVREILQVIKLTQAIYN